MHDECPGSRLARGRSRQYVGARLLVVSAQPLWTVADLMSCLDEICGQLLAAL